VSANGAGGNDRDREAVPMKCSEEGQPGSACDITSGLESISSAAWGQYTRASCYAHGSAEISIEPALAALLYICYGRAWCATRAWPIMLAYFRNNRQSFLHEHN
jgi:hypothetical protein